MTDNRFYGIVESNVGENVSAGGQEVNNGLSDVRTKILDSLEEIGQIGICGDKDKKKWRRMIYDGSK